MTLEELRVIITAETSGLKKAVKSVQNQLKSLSTNVGKITKGIANQFNNLSKSINNSFKSIAKMVGLTAVIAGLIKLGKAAVQAASDLEEIQNVVDVVFGESASEIDAWAKSALKSFGLVESEAKDVASTFKAMANGMGVADRSGKAMAIRLTELAADLASFRNTTVEQAKTALSGVFTGETEALKKFGVVMTQTNLEAYALSQGITKSYSAMSQAEKVALRYNYVLHATADAQGDFARSANSWANQIRILKGQWTAFLGVLGTAIKQVLSPLLQALNKVLEVLITITKTAFAAMGIDFSVQSAKVSSGLGEAADAAGDITDNIGNATEEAKELYHALAPFDELNLLGEKDNGSGSGGGGLGDLGGSGGLDIADAEVKLEKTEDLTMKSLEEMLKDLNDWFENTMGPWLKEKAHWLGEKINDFVDNTPWELLGYTAANGLNQIIYALDELITTINGYNLGDAIARMINSFVDKFDAAAFGKMIGDKIRLGLDIAIGFLSTFDGTQFGEKLADFFNNLDIVSIAGKLGETLSLIITDGLDIAIAFLRGTDGGELTAAWNAFWDNIDIEGIQSRLISLFNEIKIKIDEVFGDGTVDKIGKVVKAIEAIGIALLALKGLSIAGSIFDAAIYLPFITTMTSKTGILGLLEEISLRWAAFIGSLHLPYAITDWLVDPFNEMKALLTGSVFPAISTAVGALGTAVSNGLTAMGTAISNLLMPSNTLITTMTPLQTLMANLATGAKGLFSVLAAHPFAVLVAAIAAVVASFVYLWNTCETFRKFFEDIWNDTLKPIFEQIGEKWRELVEQHIKPLWENSLKPCIEAIWNTVKDVWDKIAHVIGTVIMVLTPVITGVIGILGGLLTSVMDIFGDIMDIISGILDFITGVFTGDWQKAWDGVVKIFKGIWDGIVDIAKAPINLVIGLINGMIGAIVAGLNAIISKVNGISITIPDWVPGLGGKKLGFSLPTLSAPNIPYLAQGGVLTDPTIAMMGEYPGAKQNPEIAAPQNILRETMVQANGEMVAAIYQMAMQIVNAIEEQDMNVTIGDETIAKAAKKGNDAYYKRTGKPLFAGT